MVEQANLLLGDQASVDHIMPQRSGVHFRSWPGNRKEGLHSCTEIIFHYPTITNAVLSVCLASSKRKIYLYNTDFAVLDATYVSKVASKTSFLSILSLKFFGFNCLQCTSINVTQADWILPEHKTIKACMLHHFPDKIMAKDRSSLCLDVLIIKKTALHHAHYCRTETKTIAQPELPMFKTQKNEDDAVRTR